MRQNLRQSRPRVRHAVSVLNEKKAELGNTFLISRLPLPASDLLKIFTQPTWQGLDLGLNPCLKMSHLAKLQFYSSRK